ncbi:AcrR family transcriptional regulator [Amycolatopsis bartoniae]|uniref:helix-turn-helix domain-containing protein n=1 Tax=Amycolatopsis bartoniae TaxID=941986 RepID=UPI001827E6CC|nr:helix-turn-helix domain-containing protein [Amycolatopsis bartoniae]MBB2939957.1 AcrR family transcriptional regulator [Amycolatopsis bartoniae]
MTAGNQVRGPYAKTAGRVEHILDATAELFAASGYRAATMKDIAQRAGRMGSRRDRHVLP